LPTPLCSERLSAPRAVGILAQRRGGLLARCDNRFMRTDSPGLPFDDELDAPLAERLRPKTLDEVIGQQHLLGPDKPLRAAFDSGRLHSMILWGPPGVGKTTLARLVAQGFDAQFIAISAVLGGVKDIRDAVERAQIARNSARRTIVFVDEVHRFNKAQQDAFLPHVESGLFTFIGATTVL
jgi:putative ATPase